MALVKYLLSIRYWPDYKKNTMVQNKYLQGQTLILAFLVQISLYCRHGYTKLLSVKERLHFQKTQNIRF